MEEQFRDVCALFCENHETTEPSVFFSAFQKFIESYKRAVDQINVQNNEEKALKKAKLLQAQNQKLQETAALNCKMAAETVRRRHSEFYDQNQNLLNQKQIGGSTMSLNTVHSFEGRLSMSCPRSTFNKITIGQDKELNELDESPLFHRNKYDEMNGILDKNNLSPQLLKKHPFRS